MHLTGWEPEETHTHARMCTLAQVQRAPPPPWTLPLLGWGAQSPSLGRWRVPRPQGSCEVAPTPASAYSYLWLRRVCLFKICCRIHPLCHLLSYYQPSQKRRRES